MRQSSWILIEGGGSRTRVAITSAGTTTAVDGLSTNPRSVGHAAAAATLNELLPAALAAAGIEPAAIELVVATHGAASTIGSAEEFAGLLAAAADRSGVSAPVVVSTDVLPLLFDAEREVAVAAIVGTGTDFLARRGDRFAAASGLDYLLTDEGGGFDLGLQGLRAVNRAVDGRGPTTSLVDAARRWCDAGPDRPLRDPLFTKVYGGAARPLVASFARPVVEAAQSGDAVARGLVDAAVDEVIAGIGAVLAGVGATDEPVDLVLSGSLATTDNHYQHTLLAKIAAMLPMARTIEHGDDQLTAATQRLGEFLLAQPENVAHVRQAGPFAHLRSR